MICTSEVMQRNYIVPFSERSHVSRTTDAEPGLLKILCYHLASLQFVTPLVTSTCLTPSGLAGNTLECLQTKVI